MGSSCNTEKSSKKKSRRRRIFEKLVPKRCRGGKNKVKKKKCCRIHEPCEPKEVVKPVPAPKVSTSSSTETKKSERPKEPSLRKMSNST